MRYSLILRVAGTIGGLLLSFAAGMFVRLIGIGVLVAVLAASPSGATDNNPVSDATKQDLKTACDASEEACIRTCTQHIDTFNDALSDPEGCNEGCINSYSRCLSSIEVRGQIKKYNGGAGGHRGLALSEGLLCRSQRIGPREPGRGPETSHRRPGRHRLAVFAGCRPARSGGTTCSRPRRYRPRVGSASSSHSDANLQRGDLPDDEAFSCGGAACRRICGNATRPCRGQRSGTPRVDPTQGILSGPV